MSGTDGATESPAPFARVAVVGLGLMGGSLARALKGLSAPPSIAASSESLEDLREATRAGGIDAASTDARTVLDGADLVVYATPLDITLHLLPVHAPVWPANAVISDVTSLKAPVRDLMTGIGAESRYIGAHPMVGGEGSGFGHARGDLFERARVWLVPGAGARDSEKLETFWRSVGARPRSIEAAEHDRKMAWCSHLPQLAANALAMALEESGHSAGELGTGGRDMVRLAGSAPGMWRPLLHAGRSDVEPALRALARSVTEIADALAAGDMDAVQRLMKGTRAWRG